MDHPVWVWNDGKSNLPDVETTVWEQMIHFSNTSTHYPETGNVVDQLREGCSSSVHTEQTIHTIHELVRWNFVHQKKRLPVEMSVSNCSLSCILREDLHLSVYRHCVSHLLDARLEKMRYERCKTLLKRFQKTYPIEESCLMMKRFSISRRNSIVKMTTCNAKSC